MKIKRSLLILAVLPMTVALQSSVLAQAGNVNLAPIGTTERTPGVAAAYSIGIANLARNQKSRSPQAVLLADAAPSTNDAAPSTTASAMALASTSDQLNILEKFFFNHTNSGQGASERLNLLEMTVLHKQTTGPISDRIKNLIAALPDPAKTRHSKADCARQANCSEPKRGVR